MRPSGEAVSPPEDDHLFPTIECRHDLPVVSIVSVVLRDPEGLRRTLRSLERADARYEIVIVDGEPNGVGSASIAKDLHQGASRLTIVSGNDDGPYYAMNRGILASTGSWVWFVNAGDEVALELDLDGLANRLEHAKQSWAVGGVTLVAGEQRTLNSAASAGEILRGEKSQCHQGMLVHKRALMRIGGFDTAYHISADYRMMCQLANLEEPLVLDGALAVFHRGGLSTHRRRRMYYENFRARLATRSESLDWHVVDSLRMFRRVTRRNAGRLG